MTKSELIARLAERFPQLVAKDADFAVKMILDALTSALVKGDRIEIRGFGSFALNYRPPRVGRNPKSGDKVQVLLPSDDVRTYTPLAWDHTGGATAVVKGSGYPSKSLLAAGEKLEVVEGGFTVAFATLALDQEKA